MRRSRLGRASDKSHDISRSPLRTTLANRSRPAFFSLGAL